MIGRLGAEETCSGVRVLAHERICVPVDQTCSSLSIIDRERRLWLGVVSVCSVLHREDAQGLILIGQPAHAWVSGQLARTWGNDRFGGFEPWEEVCLAAEQHDIGMAAWDAAPDLSPASGLPYSFRELPRSTHLALWASAASLVLPQSRYAALLVSLHGTGLYEPADRENGAPSDDPAVVEFLSRQRVLQDELLGSLRADDRYAPYATAGVLARNRRLVART